MPVKTLNSATFLYADEERKWGVADGTEKLEGTSRSLVYSIASVVDDTNGTEKLEGTSRSRQGKI